MNLEPLRADTLRPTQQLAAEMFPWEHEHQIALPAAVAPDAYKDFYVDRGLESVRCFTATQSATPYGMATLYGYQARREELWLAWFGLRPTVRGRGEGAQFLDWIIGRAHAEGRRVLRLWTTDEPEYQAAVRLYLRRGFVPELTPALPGESWKTLVFTLGLCGQPALPWALVPDRGELCGREHPQANAYAA